MPGRCIGEGEDGDGVAIREGLDGLDGVAGDEYEREPRLPPLPARAHTAAVSSKSSEVSASPNMNRKARVRMVTSVPILARDAG